MSSTSPVCPSPIELPPDDQIGKDVDDHCPTLAEHRVSFPPALLERWGPNYFASYSIGGGAWTVSTLDYGSYDDYISYHHEFIPCSNRLRTHELLYVKQIFQNNSTEFHDAVIRYNHRCPYCRMIGNEVTVYDSKKPCSDPFIEARDGRLSFKFPDVVAFHNTETGKLILRKDWCRATLKNETNMVAVYSKESLTFSWLQSLWMSFKWATISV